MARASVVSRGAVSTLRFSRRCKAVVCGEQRPIPEWIAGHLNVVGYAADEILKLIDTDAQHHRLVAIDLDEEIERATVRLFDVVDPADRNYLSHGGPLKGWSSEVEASSEAIDFSQKRRPP
jgi:hypothetical protein